MNFKKRLTQFIGCLSIVGLTSIPLVSCSSSFEKNQNQSNNDLNLNPSEVENGNGILDEKIRNKIKTLDNTIYDIESNIFSFDMKRENFIKTLDLSKNDLFPKFDKNKFIIDIYLFLERIYKSSNSKIDLSLDSENIVFDESFNTIEGKIELSATNPYKIVRSIFINDKEIFIPAYSTIKFNISIVKQTIKYDLIYNSNLKKNLLTWYIENANINLDDGRKIEIQNFNFNYENFSHAIPYNILNIFIENKEYLNEKKFTLDQVKSLDLKNNIENHFNYNKTTILKYIVFANDIFEKISKNPSVDALIKELTPTISSILVTAGIVPETLKNFIDNAITTTKPLTQVIQENKENILKFILSIIKDNSIDADVINSVLSLIKPNMPQQDKELFLGIINEDLIPKEYIQPLKSILNFIFNDKTTFELIEYLLSDVLNDSFLLPQEKLVVNSINILKLLFKKNNNNYKNILDILINDKQEVASLLKNILGSTSTGELIDTFYLNNQNFNINNLKVFLEKVVVPFTAFLKNSNNYEITSNFKKNNNNQDEYSYDENTKKLSYKYEMKFIFKQTFKLELNPIYDLLPNNIKVSNNSIPFSIMRSLGYLPDYIEFSSNDALEMVFNAENQYLYLSPKKEQKGYSFGYNIPYIVDVKFNMPNAFNSIFKQYKYKIFFIETIPWKFITTTVSLFMMVDYNFTGNIYVNDKNWINMNYLEDIPDLNVSFKWKDLTDDQLNQLMNNLENRESNKYLVNDKDGGSHNLVGQKPFVKAGKEQEILDLVLEFGTGISTLAENEKPIVKILPQVNGTISGFGALASFSVKIVDVYVYFPSNNRVIDMNSSKISERQFVYNNTFTKSFVVG